MSQCESLLRDLQKGRSISPIVALERHGIFRLASRILELRRRGHRIVASKMRLGRKSVAVYRLA